jgi:hypothetical protein
MQGLHEIARTAEVGARLARYVDTIPMIVWRTDVDIKRMINWLAASGATAFAVDLSTLKTCHEWRWGLGAIDLMDRTLSALNLAPHLVSIGPFTLSRLRELRTHWQHGITIFSRAAWQLSRTHTAIETTGARVKDLDRSLDELLSHNVAIMEQALAA